MVSTLCYTTHYLQVPTQTGVRLNLFIATRGPILPTTCLAECPTIGNRHGRDMCHFCQHFELRSKITLKYTTGQHKVELTFSSGHSPRTSKLPHCLAAWASQARQRRQDPGQGQRGKLAPILLASDWLNKDAAGDCGTSDVRGECPLLNVNSTLC